jgi:hypothetical protein
MTLPANRTYTGAGGRKETGDDNWPRISWVTADPRRAPVRNDAVDGLQKAAPVALITLLFSLQDKPPVTAAGAAVAVGLVFFGLGFIFSWAQMITARRPGPTVRSYRAKLGSALVEGVLIGATVVAIIARGRTLSAVDLGLGVVAAIATVAIVLGLERLAVDVPSAAEMAARDRYGVDYR